jgi:hypothetical protein
MMTSTKLHLPWLTFYVRQRKKVFLSEVIEQLLDNVWTRSVNMPQSWEAVYLQAMVEPDHDKLIGKINLAIPELRACLKELASSPERVIQRQRILDALLTLDTIRRIELKTKV